MSNAWDRGDDLQALHHNQNMRRPARWMAVGSMLLLAACASAPSSEQPAVLVHADDEQLQRLEHAVAQALSVPSVLLAQDALTQGSWLVVEPRAIRVDGQRLQGRQLTQPERFQLLRAGSRCVLLHAGTQQRQVIDGLQCRALPGAAMP